jgi:transposase
MLDFRLNISKGCRKLLEDAVKKARRRGEAKKVTRLEAVLAVADGYRFDEAARLFQVSEDTVRAWVNRFLSGGVRGLMPRKSPGRPAKLTKTQLAEVARTVEAGPKAAGFEAGCWRTPMIQEWIWNRFGVLYNTHYLSELLRNLGFSFQKARFEADHLDEIARKRWKTVTFPALVAKAKATRAHLLFGDEASFPQWGTLSYTWARRGHQPTVKTSGKRTGYKVFGLIDYFTGRLWYQGRRGKLNSESYQAFLEQVLASTDQPVILIQDGARYHTSAAMKHFFATHAHRLTVEQLPTYSPDYNPIEKLWKGIKQHHTHMQYFPTFDALTDKVEQALLDFANREADILELCGLQEAA